METKPKFTRREIATAKRIFDEVSPAYLDMIGAVGRPFKDMDVENRRKFYLLSRWHIAELAKQKGKVGK